MTDTTSELLRLAQTRIARLEMRLDNVGLLLEAHGCDCECGCDYDQHHPDCDVCFPCQVALALGEG